MRGPAFQPPRPALLRCPSSEQCEAASGGGRVLRRRRARLVVAGGQDLGPSLARWPPSDDRPSRAPPGARRGTASPPPTSSGVHQPAPSVKGSARMINILGIDWAYC